MNILRSSFLAFFVLFFSLLSLYGEAPPHHIVRRCAFDIGSGGIRMQVADVDLDEHKIVHELFAERVKVGLRKDLTKSQDSNFSKEIQEETIKVLSDLKNKAAPFNPESYAAVATEAFRIAKNANELVKRIFDETGINVTIIPQKDEGILGFFTAATIAQVNPENIITWETGGGSFQITTKCGDEFSVYEGQLAAVPMKDILVELQGKDVVHTVSPNPISQKMVDLALKRVKEMLPKPPLCLKEKLRNLSTIIIVTGANPFWPNPLDKYSISMVLQRLKDRLNLTDEELTEKDLMNCPPDEQQRLAPYTVSNLILAYGIMDMIGIKEVQYVEVSNGNTTGILLSEKYWKKKKA